MRLILRVALVLLVCAGACEAQFRNRRGRDKRPLFPRIINPQDVDVLADDGFECVGIVGDADLGGFCSGTLISPTHVLTAAHCAEVINGPFSGTFEVDGRVFTTVEVHIHPEYDRRRLRNDLAILVLEEPIQDVIPAEIFRDTPLVGDQLTIVGYGATGSAEEGSDGAFGIRNFGQTTIDRVTRTQIHWVYDDPAESNTAPGDSGGPGFLSIGETFLLASVTSGGTQADAGLGDSAFNTRVDAFADWVDILVATTPAVDPPDEPETPEPETPEREPDDSAGDPPGSETGDDSVSDDTPEPGTGDGSTDPDDEPVNDAVQDEDSACRPRPDRPGHPFPSDKPDWLGAPFRNPLTLLINYLIRQIQEAILSFTKLTSRSPRRAPARGFSRALSSSPVWPGRDRSAFGRSRRR